MEMEITFPGGARVDASFGTHTVHTDQPNWDGGEGTAPSPFDIFLASIGTCAGIYILGFLRQRGLSTEGVRLIQRAHWDPQAGMVDEIELEIQLPSNVPDKYRSAIARVAELCAVKKHLEQPPRFNVIARSPEMAVP